MASPPLFLMSPPRADWAVRGKANVFSQAGGNAPTAHQALTDWLAVADAIVDAGGGVIVLPPPDDDATLTGLPYVAEAGHVGRSDGAPLWLLPRLKPPHRQREPDHIAAVFSGWGFATRAPAATWEAQGDVLRVDDERAVLTAGVGPFARTDGAAHDDLADRLPFARTLRLGFHGDPWFHGNTFLGVFRGRGRVVVVVCPDALLPGEEQRLRAFLEGVEIVAIDKATSLTYATNALQVNDTVLAPAGVPDVVTALWRELGLTVRTLALPALFGRGGGAAVCLTNRLDGLGASAFPAAARYPQARDAVVDALDRAPP